MKSSQTVRTIAAAVALAATTLLAAGPAHAKVVKAAASPGDGLLAINAAQCSSSNIDATTTAWNWTKPMLEVSADNGATWTSAATYANKGTNYAAQVCRNLGGANAGSSAQAYWFIIQPASGNNDDMGPTVISLGLQFKVTIPLKEGDTALRMTGYSKVVSYQPSAGSVVAVVKASSISKVNGGNSWTDFLKNHNECSSFTQQTWNQCKVAKADRDIVATVIQHIEFTTTAPSAWQNLSAGVWIGANVNGYQLTMTCASKGSDSSGGNSGGSGGGNYGSSNDGGANIPSGSSGGGASTSTPPSLSVAMSGTPHLQADGLTVNKGNLQAFIPETTAKACFGDGTDTISLATIAQNMSVSRTESSENNGAAQDLAAGAYTATAVTSPVAGLLIDVAEMTFSNPTYKVSSKLAQQLLASYSAAGSSTSAATVSFAAKVSGAKVALTVTLGKAQKIKVYKKVGTKLTLVKTISAKVGPNTVSTTHKKGTTYLIKDASGKTLKSLKP